MLKKLQNKLNLILLILLVFAITQVLLKVGIDYSYIKMSKNKIVTIQPQCEYIPLLVPIDNGANYKYGYYCSNSVASPPIIPAIFEKAYPFKNDFAVVALITKHKELKYIVINKWGTPMTSGYTYISEYDFDGELAIVCNESHGYYNSRCGIINMKNEFIVSPIYSYSEIQKIKKQKFN